MKKTFTLIMLCYVMLAKADNWTQRQDAGTMSRSGGIGFSIGTKGYVGLGATGVSTVVVVKDFWEYDAGTNAWSQKASFPGAERENAVGFSIGANGYVGLGDNNAGTIFGDFYQYSPGTNTWIQRANYPGGPKQGAFAFSIGTKGYVGTGYDSIGVHHEVYEFNPVTNTWNVKANFPILTTHATAVGSGNSGYVVATTGLTSTCVCYKYNQAVNTWTSLASPPFATRILSCGFSINSNVYITTGFTNANVQHRLNDLWEYNVSANTWNQKTAFGGLARYGALGFAIGNYGYAGTGYSTSVKKDFWKYDPNSVTGIENIAAAAAQLNVYPNPAKDFIVCSIKLASDKKATLVVMDMLGRSLYSEQVALNDNTLEAKIDVSGFRTGVYFVQVIAAGEKTVRKFVKE